MEIKQKKTNRNIVIVCMLLILFSLIFFGLNRQKKRESNKRYAIGKPFKAWVSHFEWDYEYVFVVNGCKYEGRTGYSNIKPKDAIGKYFFVEFESDNPNNSKMLYKYPVLDTTIEIPKEGLFVIPLDQYGK